MQLFPHLLRNRNFKLRRNRRHDHCGPPYQFMSDLRLVVAVSQGNHIPPLPHTMNDLLLN